MHKLVSVTLSALSSIACHQATYHHHHHHQPPQPAGQPGNLGRWSGEFLKGGPNQADYPISIPKGRQVTFRVTVTVDEAEAPGRIGYVSLRILDGVSNQEIRWSQQCAAGAEPSYPNPNTCTWIFNEASREDGKYILRVRDDTGYANPDRWIGYTVDADL